MVVAAVSLALVGIVLFLVVALRERLRDVARSQEVSRSHEESVASLERLHDRLAASFGERIASLEQRTETRLGAMQGVVQQKLEETLKTNLGAFKDLTPILQGVSSAASRIADVGRHVDGLSRILAQPKLRGLAGEFQLKEILADTLPPEKFEMPFAVADGYVDAVIHLAAGDLYIDAKFPLDDFRRSLEPGLGTAEIEAHRKAFFAKVKTEIASIRKKYLLQGTGLDYALLFVPSEVVFLELIQNVELHRHAIENHVVPCSPVSLFAYLQAIALGFRSEKVAEDVQRVEQQIRTLAKKFETFWASFEAVGQRIVQAQKAYDDAGKHAGPVTGIFNSLVSGDVEK